MKSGVAALGEPTFAAFYPNCQSVFGLHDAAPPAPLRGVQYDVIGWYSDPTQDCLRSQEIRIIKQRLKGTPAGITQEALKEGYQWEMSEDPAAKGDPEKTVFYGCLTIEADTPPSALRQDKQVIAVGNTGTQGAIGLFGPYAGSYGKYLIVTTRGTVGSTRSSLQIRQ
jgi:hypothetical protein